MSITILAIVTFLGLLISSLAKRIHFPSELLIVIVAGGLSFVPFIPEVDIEGSHLLEIILPPLLFSAARNLSGYKFRKMRTPILYLGVLMIFLTAFLVAIVISTLVGFMTLWAGLILGAVVAPPDAVSSVSIGKKLGLPDRVMTVLTGESLINDASALTLFTFACALTYHQKSFIEHPAGLFLWTSLVGVLTGSAGGVITFFTRKILKESNLISVFTAIVPFVIYIWTEHIFHASGVLAVVAAGFIVEKSTYKASHITRLQEQSLWKSLETLLDSFVFAFVGLRVKVIIEDLHESQLDTFTTIGFGFLVLLVVILARPIGVLGFNAFRLLWYKAQVKRVRHFVPSKKLQKKASNMLSDAPISWREYVVLSWAGMRGVVTLAAASSIPKMLESQTVIIYTSNEYKIHIFIQVVGMIVAIGTLLLQGLTLPILIKKVLPPTVYGDLDPLDGQWGKARLLMENSALKVIDSEYEADPDNFDRDHVIEVWKSLGSENIGKNKRDISFISGLLTEIVETQRTDMQNAALTGEIHPDIAKEYLNKLDYHLASFTYR